MPYNPDCKLLYIHIPKTAGTSITSYLGFKEGRQYCYIQNQQDKKPVAMHHMTPEQLVKNKLLTENDLLQSLSFTFVRNPFDRLVSEFHYLNRYRPPEEISAADFTAYIKKMRKYFLLHHWSHHDNHLRPQWQFVSYKKKQVIKHIFRFEELQSGIDNITEIVAKELGLELGSNHFSHTRKSQRTSYQDYYDSYTKKLVEKWYAKDLKYFGYRF